MSGEPRGGFSPTEKPGKLTVAEFQQVAGVVRDLLADQPIIKWSIYAAGAAGLLDTIHWSWLFVGFLYRSLK
jgi:hypothetical protein